MNDKLQKYITQINVRDSHINGNQEKNKSRKQTFQIQ